MAVPPPPPGESETYGEYSSQYKKNNFMLNAGQD